MIILIFFMQFSNLLGYKFIKYFYFFTLLGYLQTLHIISFNIITVNIA